MTKNGEDVQSKVVAEVKQTTVALYEACTSSRIMILSSRPIMSIVKKHCGWIGTHHARCREQLNWTHCTVALVFSWAVKIFSVKVEFQFIIIEVLQQDIMPFWLNKLSGGLHHQGDGLHRGWYCWLRRMYWGDTFFFHLALFERRPIFNHND